MVVVTPAPGASGGGSYITELSSAMNPNRLHVPGVPGATQTQPAFAPLAGTLFTTMSPTFQVPSFGAPTPSVTPARFVLVIPPVRFSKAVGKLTYPVTSAFCQRQRENVTGSEGSFLKARELLPSNGVSTE